MKAYIVRSQMYDPKELTNIENRTEVIDATASVGIDKKNSESLYYLLCLTCKGAAQTVLRRTPPGNGPETWRQQQIRYGQKDMMSSMSMLQALLVFSFGSSVDQNPDRLVEFEALIMRYEAEPNVDALSDVIKKAVLVRGCPEPLKTHLLMNLQTYVGYGSIRNAVQTYTEAKRTEVRSCTGEFQYGHGMRRCVQGWLQRKIEMWQGEEQNNQIRRVLHLWQARPRTERLLVQRRKRRKRKRARSKERESCQSSPLTVLFFQGWTLEWCATPMAARYRLTDEDEFVFGWRTDR